MLQDGTQWCEIQRAIAEYCEDNRQVARRKTEGGAVVVHGPADVLGESRVACSFESYSEFGNRTCRYFGTGNSHTGDMPALREAKLLSVKKRAVDRGGRAAHSLARVTVGGGTSRPRFALGPSDPRRGWLSTAMVDRRSGPGLDGQVVAAVAGRGQAPAPAPAPGCREAVAGRREAVRGRGRRV